MEQLTKATLWVQWHTAQSGRENPEPIPVQFNPAEFTLDKSAQIAEITIPGLDAPIQQFVRGQAEKLTLDLFFDTTEHGMGTEKSVVSVTKWTDSIYQLIKIEPKRHAPPICILVWNAQFPGSSIGNLTPVGNNQNRNGFQCIVESVKQKFTLFSPEGVPLRATLTVTFREYKTLEQQLVHLGWSSPDRTHAHAVQREEKLADIAAQYYSRPGEWRPIAEANNIEDPRRISAGVFLTIPPL
ncbi:MAG: CIS tube protein [Anaerolineales bacterium]